MVDLPGWGWANEQDRSDVSQQMEAVAKGQIVICDLWPGIRRSVIVTGFLYSSDHFYGLKKLCASKYRYILILF